MRDRKAAGPDPGPYSFGSAWEFGDCKAVGAGVSEMRIDVGPGYRVYYTRRGETLYLLLAGGNKSTQPRDVKRARDMLRQLEACDLH